MCPMTSQQTVPNLPSFVSDKMILTIIRNLRFFSDEKILTIIRNLNPNKAHGWDEISVRMIKMCDASLVKPLKLIFEKCLSQGIFPDVRKRADIVPVHKKNEKNLKTNYRPISLLPIFGKVLEKLIFDSLYSH